MTDVFLYQVPSDVANNDVRLRDPTQVASVSLALAVTEAPDVAAVNLLDSDLLALAATESPDVAAITILDKDQLSLAVTEAADTAAVTLLDTDQFALAATESADTAAVNLLDSDQLALAATEAPDVADFTVTAIARPSQSDGGGGGKTRSARGTPGGARIRRKEIEEAVDRAVALIDARNGPPVVDMPIAAVVRQATPLVQQAVPGITAADIREIVADVVAELRRIQEEDDEAAFMLMAA